MASMLICSIVLLLLSTGMACTDLTLGIVQTNPATSCNEIYKCNPYYDKRKLWSIVGSLRYTYVMIKVSLMPSKEYS